MSRNLFKLWSVLTILTLLARSQMVRADDLIVGEYFNNRAYEILNGVNVGVFASSSGTTRFEGMAFDTKGYLYVSGGQSNNVQRFSPTGTDPKNFVTTGLSDTAGLAFDAKGNLYVCNYGNNTVRWFSPAGADRGVFATVSEPLGIAFDSFGYLYVSNAYGTVHRFSPQGTDLGVIVSVSSSNDLQGLAFDTAGNLYISDETNNQIYRCSRTGTDLQVFASTGLDSPCGIAFDTAGNLFVANYGGSTVRKFSAAGIDLGDFVTGLSNPECLAFRPSTPASLVLTPDLLTGVASSRGTVTLTYAPATETTVTLANSDTTATSVPADITIPAGKASATFTVTSHLVAAYAPVTIIATAHGVSKRAELLVAPKGNPTLTLNPTSEIGGIANATGTITVPGKAPVGGIPITLASSNPSAASVLTDVTIPEGQTRVTFRVTTNPVATVSTCTITASFLESSKSANLTVEPAQLSSVSISPDAVLGGANATGTVFLMGEAAMGGATITLGSNASSVASVPATVTVPAGKTKATFTVTTSPVATDSTASITASFGAVSSNAGLTVNAATIAALSLKPTIVKGGKQNSMATLTLTGKAPTGGLVVTLASSDTSSATVPAMVTVPGGSKTVSFTVTSMKVTATQNPVILAITEAVSKTATLTVTP